MTAPNVAPRNIAMTDSTLLAKETRAQIQEGMTVPMKSDISTLDKPDILTLQRQVRIST